MYHDHFHKERPVNLTDHERTELMMRLDQSVEPDRSIGAKLAYNEDWANVFRLRTRKEQSC